MAAITDAAVRGVSTRGATLYCTTYPCHLCARLIIASGIKKVVFIEPYPKSKAALLYRDSISSETSVPDGKKVSFEAFVGVAPVIYDRLFQYSLRRKNSLGQALKWNSESSAPLVRRYQTSYISLEKKVAEATGAKLEMNGLAIKM
jgi:cytidine deaminase